VVRIQIMRFARVCHYTFSTSGGAGRVAQQLSSGLNDYGIPSQVQSLTKGDIKDCLTKHPVLVGQALFDFYIVRNSFDLSLYSLFRDREGMKFSNEASTIHHLHWTPGAFTVQQIGQLLKSEIPKVWTLHDMWSFTGGCHHSMDCIGYRNGCLQCPQIRKPFSRLAERSLQLKKKEFRQNKNFIAITPSKWLQNRATESEVFNGSDFRVIPNPVDTQLFQPAQIELNSNSKQLIVGCNATNLSDPMKGIDSLIVALENFQFQHPEIKVILLAIGSGKIISQKIEIRKTGFLSDQNQIALAYKQMDIFVSMSKAEVFPLSIAEAQSCGLPIVCLDSGGMPEMIQPGRTGFVVKSPQELIYAVDQFVQPETKRKEMRELARNYALDNYSTEVVIHKYADVYKSLILD
jgi:glycosyltransferase involved in cell wall biosynthesis